MESLGFQPREEATVGTLTRETVTVGAIGPEHLDENQSDLRLRDALEWRSLAFGTRTCVSGASWS